MGATPAVFVGSHHSLADSPGGQQMCTREYIAALEAAGFQMEVVKFTAENRLRSKILRRLTNRPYRYFVPDGVEHEIRDVCRRLGAEFVFLNVADLAPLAPRVKRVLPESRVVLLSHGLESVDYLHQIRSQVLQRDFGNLKRSQELRLARQLIAECQHRRYIDAVLCLSIFEAGIERWLGARRVMPVPRTVTPNFLAWEPVENRVGFVGRIDHPPNLEGLDAFLWEVDRRGDSLKVRIVGMPESSGRQLAQKYHQVEYLGALSDEELRAEAATWNCFLHPLFCYARGASTKLAVGLSWGIPVVTTSAGCRGYEWSAGSVTITETPTDFADATAHLVSTFDARVEAARAVRSLVHSMPSIDDVAQRVADFLVGDEPAVESDWGEVPNACAHEFVR